MKSNEPIKRIKVSVVTKLFWILISILFIFLGAFAFDFKEPLYLISYIVLSLVLIYYSTVAISSVNLFYKDKVVYKNIKGEEDVIHFKDVKYFYWERVKERSGIRRMWSEYIYFLNKDGEIIKKDYFRKSVDGKMVDSFLEIFVQYYPDVEIHPVLIYMYSSDSNILIEGREKIINMDSVQEIIKIRNNEKKLYVFLLLFSVFAFAYILIDIFLIH